MTTKENEVKHRIRNRKIHKFKQSTIKTAKRRLPILSWLTSYNFTFLIQDIIAGVTVGLTAIPQGMGYAVVSGLSPEYGLYSSLLGGFIYLFIGSCKDITIGPNAILSVMITKYVTTYNADFSVLASFLTGIIILVMGILQLGFLVEFISVPVISGFTTAAALQIASVQLKSLFGLDGPSGDTFLEAIYYFVQNISTIKIFEPILGFVTIGILLVLKRLGNGCSRDNNKIKWIVSLSRNAIVVMIGMIITFGIKSYNGSEPLAIIGDVGNGIPKFELPPFSTIVRNETYSFKDMLKSFGPESLVIPLVAIVEHVAIAKAFSGGMPVDATQEMVALGLSNIFGSFVKSFPITGSFTRTTLNNASGVKTPAGGIFTGVIIILALSLLTSSFYFIAKASLAGLIITAMFSMINYSIFGRLWRTNKREFVIYILTLSCCLCLRVEYGMIIGVAVDAALLLYSNARPVVEIDEIKCESGNTLLIKLTDNLAYCAADYIRKELLTNVLKSNLTVLVEGSSLRTMNITVALNLITLSKDLQKNSKTIYFLNFNQSIRDLVADISPECVDIFISASSVDEFMKINKL